MPPGLPPPWNGEQPPALPLPQSSRSVQGQKCLPPYATVPKAGCCSVLPKSLYKTLKLSSMSGQPQGTPTSSLANSPGTTRRTVGSTGIFECRNFHRGCKTSLASNSCCLGLKPALHRVHSTAGACRVARTHLQGIRLLPGEQHGQGTRTASRCVRWRTSGAQGRGPAADLTFPGDTAPCGAEGQSRVSRKGFDN